MDPSSLGAALRSHPSAAGVELLVLHGSRARGDATPTSDRDLGYLPGPDADVDTPSLVDAVASVIRAAQADVLASLP